MNHLRIFIVVMCVALVSACSTKPTVNKESLQGTWTCFEFNMTGEGITPAMEAQSKVSMPEIG